MNKIVIYNLDTHARQNVELTIDEATEIRQILSLLESDMEMEVLHDQVVEAFWDYRNKVDYWRLRSLAGFRAKILSYEVKSTLNRLAFNVLNLSKLFLDKHYHKDKDVCFAFRQTGSPEHKKSVSIIRQKILDKNVRYLIGCKLRNRSQHGQLPISQFTSGFKLRKTDEKRFATFNVTLNYNDLKRIGVPESRIKQDTKFDLTEILDGYIHAISEMHLHNRELTEEIVSISRG